MTRLWLSALVLAATMAEAQQLQPAELPPAGYAGLQYVDSKGCLFARAGGGAEVLWIPRVSRDGVPDCGHPPSGKRVPVVEEVGVQPVPAPTSVPAAGVVPGFFVAVGSFSGAANADRAQARLGKLDYPSVRKLVQRADGPLITVLAGPFADKAAARAARRALRKAGFADARLVGP